MIPTIGVYRLNIGDYFYIGSSTSLNSRIKKHLNGMKSNKHENSFVQRVFNKYGVVDFEILAVCEQEEVMFLEQMFINQNFENKNCMNLSPTANSVQGIKRTPEQIEAQKKRGVSQQFLDASRNFARNRPPETIEKIRQNALGHVVSQETREKIRQSLAKITWDDAREIRRLDSLGYDSRPSIAKKFGISNAMVHKICKNVSWVEVA